MSSPDHDRPPHGVSDRARRRVLLAEDDAEMRRLLELALGESGYQVVALPDGAELVDELERCHADPAEPPFSVIISDIRMPGPSGLGLLDALRDLHWLPPVILITAFGSQELHEKARRLGALATLDKPFDMSALVRLVRSAEEASTGK